MDLAFPGPLRPGKERESAIWPSIWHKAIMSPYLATNMALAYMATCRSINEHGFGLPVLETGSHIDPFEP